MGFMWGMNMCIIHYDLRFLPLHLSRLHKSELMLYMNISRSVPMMNFFMPPKAYNCDFVLTIYLLSFLTVFTWSCVICETDLLPIFTLHSCLFPVAWLGKTLILLRPGIYWWKSQSVAYSEFCNRLVKLYKIQDHIWKKV